MTSIANMSSGVSQAAAAAASPQPTTATASSASTSSSDNDLASMSSTFLTLLTQELQNQDPTAPMDSTEMVGQMISLNQLDQLTSINQILTNQFPSASAGLSGTGDVSADALNNAASSAANTAAV